MFSVRLATEKDDFYIGELLVESFLSTYAKKMPEVRLSSERLQTLRNVAARRKLAKVFVLETQEGKIAGTVCLFPPGVSTSEAWETGYCDLRMMGLLPGYHGQNLAAILLNHALDEARLSGSQGVMLHVRQGAWGLEKFYKKFGFIRDYAGDINRLPEIYLEAYRLNF